MNTDNKPWIVETKEEKDKIRKAQENSFATLMTLPYLPHEWTEHVREKKEREEWRKIELKKREVRAIESNRRKVLYIKQVELYYDNKRGKPHICPVCKNKLKYIKSVQSANDMDYGYDGDYYGEIEELWQCRKCKYHPYYIKPKGDILRKYIWDKEFDEVANK